MGGVYIFNGVGWLSTTKRTVSGGKRCAKRVVTGKVQHVILWGVIKKAPPFCHFNLPSVRPPSVLQSIHLGMRV